MQFRKPVTVQSYAKTVSDYLADPPTDSRRAVETVRRVILESWPDRYEKSTWCGIISCRALPSGFPDTDNAAAPLNLKKLDDSPFDLGGEAVAPVDDSIALCRRSREGSCSGWTSCQEVTDSYSMSVI